MTPCPKCGSGKVVEGRLCNSGETWTAVFRPASTPTFHFSLDGGVPVDSTSLACPDCGHLWSSLSPEELRAFVTKHCPQS